MIFDSLIGNQDRHSENWALIRSLNTDYITQNKKKLRKLIIDLYNRYLREKKLPLRKFLKNQWDDFLIFDYKFSKIYDSGSSLGREISEEKVESFLDEKKLVKYIQSGNSEIRVNFKKVNHFFLLQELFKGNELYLKKRIEEVTSKFHSDTFQRTIMDIDSKLPQNLSVNSLSLHRKQFIFRNIEKRIELLIGIVS